MSFEFRSDDHGLSISPLCLIISLTVVVRIVGYELGGPSEKKPGGKKPYGLLPRLGDCKIRRDVEIGELP